MIEGRDLRTIASGCMCNDLVVFRDAQGIIHEVYGAMRVRVEGVRYVILTEDYNDFKLKVGVDKSLAEAINKFEKEYYKEGK